MTRQGYRVAILAGLTALGLMIGYDRLPGQPTAAQRPVLSAQVSDFGALAARVRGIMAAMDRWGQRVRFVTLSIWRWCVRTPYGRYCSGRTGHDDASLL